MYEYARLTQGGPAICASMHLCRCPGGPLGGATPAGLGLVPWETLPVGRNIGRVGGRNPPETAVYGPTHKTVGV